ncbi:ABC transporter substrate-binding protein [Gaiella sp.]|uniref:ABC transporter substrate-binding protein n=1 Tax=Gaiella sp. TaxID=2663207 RepID=UPI003265E917
MKRRELLTKAGAIGAGAVAAGSLAGTATAGRKATFATPKIRRGGRLIMGLESDPVAVAPYGMAPGAAHWGKEHSYDSLAEWDRNLNMKPALATSWKVESKTAILFNLRKGVRFHNGKELTADDVKYSVEKMLKVPPPGSQAVAANVPATILGADVVSKYQVRLRMSAPDARVVGFFAWQRYSPIVPEGLYDQINVSRNAIGTGPYRMVGFNPLDRVELVRNERYWKPGQPYMDAITLKVMTDEQARIAALRAGAIDLATLSVDAARSLRNDSSLQVISNLNAAFRELQMSLKPGKNEPWADVRVRRAVNHAINRQQIINTVYSGEAAFTSFVPPGYGPWPLTPAELKNKYAKYDLPMAKKLMADAGMSKGFSVNMTIVSLQDYPSVAALLVQQMKAINIDVNIKGTEIGTFASIYSAGTYDWFLNGRGMRGDVDGYVQEFHPASSTFRIQTPAYKNLKAWKAIGNGRIQLDEAKRKPMYRTAQQALWDNPIQMPLVAIRKYQVASKRVQNHYVSFSDFNGSLRTVWLSS